MSKLEQLQALREAKSSRGGVESRHARPAQRSHVASALRLEKGAAGGTGNAPSQAGVASSPRETKRGRPRIEDVAKTLQATKPWVAAGMSERTWYRRRAEKRAT